MVVFPAGTGAHALVLGVRISALCRQLCGTANAQHAPPQSRWEGPQPGLLPSVPNRAPLLVHRSTQEVLRRSLAQPRPWGSPQTGVGCAAPPERCLPWSVVGTGAGGQTELLHGQLREVQIVRPCD